MSRSRSFAGPAAALAASFMVACGGGASPSTPSRPAPVAPTPPPDSIAPGSLLQIVSAETGEAIDGAAVTLAGKSYTSVAGRITVEDRVPLRSEVGVVAPGMLERRTLVRDPATTTFALWPRRSPTGMDEGYTQALVYTGEGDFSPLRRLMRGTTRVAVVMSAELRTDADAVAAHQEAADRMTAAAGGRVVYALAPQAPASGVWVDVKLGFDSYCASEYTLGYEQDFIRNGEIVRAQIVYCDYKVARTSTASHEMGHTFGLCHSPDKAELMYAYYNGHGAVDFSPRESLVMRLMLQRPAGNVFPDDDRGATAAAGAAERTHVTICRGAPIR